MAVAKPSCGVRWFGSMLPAAALLAGCTAYHPLPLPTEVRPAHGLAYLAGAPPAGKPLDMATLERLVVLNNPALKAVRAEHAVGEAQLLQAGLLPNPAVQGSAGFLMAGAGNATAWTAGLGEDIHALLTLHQRRKAARAGAGQIDAGILWQEWQTVAKARLLLVDITAGERLLALERQQLALLSQRGNALRQGLQAGHVDLATAAPALAATAQAARSQEELARHLLAQRHELATLLGLDAAAPFALKAEPLPAPLDPATLQDDLRTLAHRRPDLVALQLGYQAEEASLRAAVLAQFPVISFGAGFSQDNSRVRNGGPVVSFELPLFDRNQGNIAIEQATRQQLHDEYAARLEEAVQAILALQGEQTQARAQLASLEALLPQARHLAAQAEAAWRDGLIDLRAHVDLMLAAQEREADGIALEQTIAEQQVLMETLLAHGMPGVLGESTRHSTPGAALPMPGGFAS